MSCGLHGDSAQGDWKVLYKFLKYHEHIPECVIFYVQLPKTGDQIKFLAQYFLIIKQMF